MNNKPNTFNDWTVSTVGQTQTIGAKGFQKRELVITDNAEKYPQFRLIEATQDKCIDLDGIAKGDKVNVDVWSGGRQWTNPEGVVKTFNSDRLAKIEKIAHDWDVTTAAINEALPADDENDLPF